MPELSPLPWEQQPGETPRAFGAFCVYRDLGPRRTLPATVTPYCQRTSPALRRQFEKWSSTFRWVERASAWDRHLDEEARATQVAARREMAERHAREARALQAKALERLRALLPETLSAADVLRYFIEAAKLERLALGEPETVQRQEMTGKGGGPLHFSVEDAVAAARELEEAERDYLQYDRSATLPAGSPEVP